ncbi:MAG TPA: alpha/beta fold hydrolase [Candidatus Binatia bacterium]|nr:alpha/beta fold hydrolase [Candidatus Binatia bacterium]
MLTRVVHFYSEGSRLEGDYFLPEGIQAGKRHPGIVLCHGYSGIRSLVLPDYAKRFVAAGYAVLSFDYRGFGGSEGPKWRIMALEQIDDIRNAITWLEAQAEVDAERIGVWGTSNGGAHAPYVAGVDERVKAAVGQVGYGDGRRLLLDIRTPEERRALMKLLAEDRRRRVLTGSGGAVDCATLLSSAQTRAFFAEALKVAPELYSEIPWASAEKTMEYRPVDVVDRIAPRALLLIGAEKDDLCKFDGYRELYGRAREPKRLVGLPITHYEIYAPPWLDESAQLAIDWFDRHLKPV